jgi:predicted nuclease of predicted toxin-antitoxin system
MKFILDSCISLFAVNSLRSSGYEVLWIPDLGKDPGDKEIMDKAVREDYILVTADKDFGELIFSFGLPHPCLIRLADIPAKKQGEIILKLVKDYSANILNKSLFTVEKHRVRIRRMD